MEGINPFINVAQKAIRQTGEKDEILSDRKEEVISDSFASVPEEKIIDADKLKYLKDMLKENSDSKILVSSCLAGINCRYNCGNCLNDDIKKLVDDGKAIPVCPETLGGLSTPRPPAEIPGGDGGDVLTGTAKVINKQGEDVSKFFINGAELALNTAIGAHVILAVLKSKSPSCGVGKIYDGTFTGGLKKGDGIAATKLREAGIKVISDEQWNLA